MLQKGSDMARPVVHFEITGKDARKLQDFYGKLFDWKIDADNPMSYGMVEAGEGGIGGGIAATDDGSAGWVTFYVEVDDLQAHLRRAKGLGGKTVVPVTTVPDMVTFALLADPEGHVIGLVKSEEHEHPH